MSRGFGGIQKLIARLLKDEEGQALTEYIILLGAGAVGATLMTRGLLKVIDSQILNLGMHLEGTLKTGRATPDVWWN